MSIANLTSGVKKIGCLTTIVISLFNNSFSQPSGFIYGKEITIDATKVSGSSALVDFPILVNITDPDLISTANGGHVENSNGYDIVFTSSDCSNILDHEIESYNAMTGEFIAWVRIPILDNAANTIIQVYYGNSMISTDPSTTGVWSSNYENVYHMNQDPSGSAPQMAESTANNGRDATSSGSMTTVDLVTGQIGEGIALDGTDDQFTSTSTSVLDQTVTWSIWINLNGNANTFDGLFYDGGGINIMSDNTVRVAWGGAFTIATTATLIPSQWTYVAVAINGTPPIAGTNDVIYIGSGGSISTYQYVNRDFVPLDFSSFRIGNQNCCSNSRFLNASIDEARFISATLSADWVATEYNNQYSPSTFYSFTDEMNAGDLCATLPIELLNFSAVNNEDKYIELNWSTLSETNNDYFTIERSQDGISFKPIGNIDGTGNSTKIQVYSFIDSHPNSGFNYYRIRQTDFDGSFDFTGIESVYFNKNLNIFIKPNPVFEYLNIYGLLSSGATITLHNLSGILIEKVTIEEDLSELKILTHDFETGIYIMTVENERTVIKKKVVKK